MNGDNERRVHVHLETGEWARGKHTHTHTHNSSFGEEKKPLKPDSQLELSHHPIDPQRQRWRHLLGCATATALCTLRPPAGNLDIIETGAQACDVIPDWQACLSEPIDAAYLLVHTAHIVVSGADAGALANAMPRDAVLHSDEDKVGEKRDGIERLVPVHLRSEGKPLGIGTLPHGHQASDA